MLEVDTGDLSKFLASRYKAGIGNRSSARILSSLRRFLRLLHQGNRITIDLYCIVESPHIGRTLPVSLSEQDVELLHECSPR